MKNFKFRWLLLSFILSIASINTAWARTYSNEEILYVKNIKPAGWGDCWKTSSGAMWATFDDGSDKYVATKLFSTDTEGDENIVYTIQVPNGTHTTIKLHRGSSLSDQWNETAAILLDDTKNYITGGYTSGASTANWDTYALHDQGVTYYLHPNSNWLSATQRFAAYFFDGKHEKWVNMTEQATGFYKVTVPDRKWPYVIFCRMNGGTSDNNWTNKWNQSDNMAPSSDAQGFNNCVWITKDKWDKVQSWTKYAPNRAIWFTPECDYTSNVLTSTATANVYSVDINLSANTTYYFKVAEGVEGGWWGYSNNDDYRISFVGQTSGHTLYQGTVSDQKVVILKTAGAGQYTFSWNSSSHEIKVNYPEVTHPNSNYIYFKNNYGWTNVMAHVFGGTPASTGWNALPVLSSFNFDGDDYYYAASGGSSSILVAKETTDSGVDKTADLTVSKGYGKWYDVVNKSTKTTEQDANWKNFTATLSLNGEGATTAVAPTSVTVTYNATTNINTDVITTTPQKTGYAFGGFYTGQGGAGTQLITDAEKIPSDLDGYTSSGKWIKTGSSVSATLYAKWTQTVKLHDNNGDAHSGSVTATYNATSVGSITAPTRDGYTVEGYYAEAGCTHKVMEANGTLVNYTGYVAEGKWIHNAASTLYAKWTEDTHTVTLANDGHGHVEIGGKTVTLVSGIGVETSSAAITAVPNTGYKFASWSGDIGSGVTIASGEGTATITINATADSKTITANFDPKSCAITFDKNGGTNGSNGTTATYDAAMTTIDVPNKIGYAFDGYWDAETADEGSGTKYYNADGTSAHTWDKNTESETTLYAKWVADNNKFTNETGNGNWNNAGNWSARVVPTNSYAAINISSNVTIADGVTVHVGQITVDPGQKLTIEPGGVLEVAGTVTTSSYEDLVIKTSSAKQGALILDNSTGTTQATVGLTSIASKDGDSYTFQYVAIPVNIVGVSEAFSGSNVYTFAWSEGSGWTRRGYYDDLFAFEAIGLTQKTSAYYTMQGTLARTPATLEHTIKYTSGTNVGLNIFGNSWTAPIKISQCAITGNASQTIYVHDNSTGIWTGYPTSAAGEDEVIPAMQAYGVLGKSGGGTLTINYDDAVRGVNSAYRSTALRAPKRNTAEKLDEIQLILSDGEHQTNLRLFENAEMFTDEFDNGWEATYIKGDGRSGQLVAQADEKMTVLATPDLEGTVVSLIPGQATDYTISFSGEGDGYYLNDVKKGQSTLIAEGNTYMFTSDAESNAIRFVISRTPIHKVPTGMEDVSAGTSARKQMVNGVLYIIRDGRIYNAEGALVK